VFVDPVSIADQRVEQRAHFEELMPVSAGSSEARHLNAYDHANVTQSNFGNEAPKAWPINSGCAGFAKIVVNNGNLLTPPP